MPGEFCCAALPVFTSRTDEWPDSQDLRLNQIPWCAGFETKLDRQLPEVVGRSRCLIEQYGGRTVVAVGETPFASLERRDAMTEWIADLLPPDPARRKPHQTPGLELFNGTIDGGCELPHEFVALQT